MFLSCRIDWLSQGSRALFGTVIEEQIYILIDTSESMVPSIQYVKDKLFLLMQVRNSVYLFILFYFIFIFYSFFK